jgi:hypothetical protein
MAAHKAGRNVHRSHAGSGRTLGSNPKAAHFRQVDQPGPGHTYALELAEEQLKTFGAEVMLIRAPFSVEVVREWGFRRWTGSWPTWEFRVCCPIKDLAAVDSGESRDRRNRRVGFSDRHKTRNYKGSLIERVF